MKHLALMSIIAAGVISLASCGNKTQNNIEFIDSAGTEQASTDITLFGICGEGSAMNTLQLITDSGDTISLHIEDANDSNKVIGSYAPGDRMAVLVSKDMKEPKVIINESTLLGKWIMPNPLDGSSDVGINIKDGGIVESIDQPSLIYKTWRIVDGMIELTLVREGGGDEEETNRYYFYKLDADSLVFYNNDDRFEYGRLKANVDKE